MNIGVNNRWVMLLGAVVVLLVFVTIREVWYSYTDNRPVLDEKVEALQLLTYEGKTVEVSDFEGNVLVMYSWASWCPFCKDGLLTMSALSEEYGETVTFVAVNRGESLVDARAFTDSLGLSKRIVLLLDPEDRFYKTNGGYAMPEIIFLTKRGKIAQYQRGPLSTTEMRARVADMFR